MTGAPAFPQRLRRSADVSAVLRSPRQRAGRLAVVYAREQGGGPPRVAVVASRRVGGAVVRNRAKRLLREASGRVAWKQGTDVVLVARAAGARSTMDEVRTELEHLAHTLDVAET